MYELLKSQKNEVFNIIRECDLEPANFSWRTTRIKSPFQRERKRESVYEVPRLIYKNSQFYFQFELRNGRHHCTFSPSKDTPLRDKLTRSWEEQKRYVKLWLNCLKREIEAPDLWAEMGKYKTSISLALPEQVRNEPIPAYEAEEIANKMQALADKIDELFELTEDQNQFVHSKLDYLANAAKRQRSMDWVHTSIGVCVTIAMSLALTPDKARKLWQLMKSLVGPLLHLIGP